MANEYGPNMDSGFNDDTIWRFGGAPIGLRDSGPEIIADGPHVAVGVVGVSINGAGNLVIETDGSIDPICIAGATPDETLSGVDVDCGPSVASASTVVVFSKNGVHLDLNNATDYAVVKGSSSNIWAFWGSPVVRGTGGPSLAQQALDLINNNILPRLAALESVQS
jgi:hypothetical protein